MKRILSKKIFQKYRLVILNDQNLSERISVRLTPLNVVLLVSSFASLLIILTVFLIAKTALKEYIPGYSDPKLRKELNELLIKFDSVNNVFVANEVQWQRLKAVLNDDLPQEFFDQPNKPARDFLNDEILPDGTLIDSLLRTQLQDNLMLEPNLFFQEEDRFKRLVLFNPFGVDFANNYKSDLTGHYFRVKKNAQIFNMLEGRLVAKQLDWDGYTTFVLQHAENLTTVYKFFTNDNLVLGTFIPTGYLLGQVKISDNQDSSLVYISAWQDGMALLVPTLIKSKTYVSKP